MNAFREDRGFLKESRMASKVQRIALFSAAAVFLCLALPGSAQTPQRQAARSSDKASAGRTDASKPARPVPPYFKSAQAAEPLPATLPPSRFAGRPVVMRSYEIAAKIPAVLAQEPCYCGCDHHFGHRSLLDCHTSDHTAGCAVCVKETFLAYELHKQGKTPAEIRQAIVRGDWKKVDLLHPPVLSP
jgi:Protein of unknown function with PCYCGC motif